MNYLIAILVFSSISMGACKLVMCRRYNETYAFGEFIGDFVKSIIVIGMVLMFVVVLMGL